MLNKFTIVGRILELETDNDNNIVVSISVQRPYKNLEGVYESDIVSVELGRDLGIQTMEYCVKGDIIGVEGRIQTKDNNIEFVAKRVSFLSNKKEEN